MNLDPSKIVFTSLRNKRRFMTSVRKLRYQRMLRRQAKPVRAPSGAQPTRIYSLHDPGFCQAARNRILVQPKAELGGKPLPKMVSRRSSELPRFSPWRKNILNWYEVLK